MEAKVMERHKGLTDIQKKELKRHGPKGMLCNMINIARQSEDPSNLKEEIVSIMRHCDLTKQGVVAIFDGQESKKEFVQGLEGID